MLCSAMAPAVARFPHHPLDIPPLQQDFPGSPGNCHFPGGCRRGLRKQSTSYVTKNLAPIKVFEGQRQEPVRSDCLYRGCCDCSQPGVGVPRRGVWALWLMDVVDSSQGDASLEG